MTQRIARPTMAFVRWSSAEETGTAAVAVSASGWVNSIVFSMGFIILPSSKARAIATCQIVVFGGS